MKFDEQDDFLGTEVQTKDGSKVLIRPARPQDREAVERMFRACSSETLYTRFLSPGLGVPLRYLDRLIANHPPTVSAMVAEAPDGDQTRIVGLTNFIETVPGQAGEVAIIVHDDYQNRGLGTVMTNCLREVAQHWKVKKFIADIDASNRRVFHLIKRSGLPSTVTIDQGIAHVEMEVAAAP
jgi:acetyltransferase